MNKLQSLHERERCERQPRITHQRKRATQNRKPIPYPAASRAPKNFCEAISAFPLQGGNVGAVAQPVRTASGCGQRADYLRRREITSTTPPRPASGSDDGSGTTVMVAVNVPLLS